MPMMQESKRKGVINDPVGAMKNQRFLTLYDGIYRRLIRTTVLNPKACKPDIGSMIRACKRARDEAYRLATLSWIRLDMKEGQCKTTPTMIRKHNLN